VTLVNHFHLATGGTITNVTAQVANVPGTPQPAGNPIKMRALVYADRCATRRRRDGSFEVHFAKPAQGFDVREHDDTKAGGPGQLLAVSGEAIVSSGGVSGWTTFTFTQPVPAQAGPIYLAFTGADG
jgi:hypothetical protein